ncbi:DUF4232 domain-containing protein [Amycolatopsis sp. K13G38]|uniref:DUF4232 domain-containing protein n=1 Tax=Amycolatopsis acididurans TaxID=2724524 RepID=A0ABX1JEK9_9PSEU|nr:DUF4232 domain-containing protein [Amycolatopsis acididurans]NKQ58173.1 DUF4232 domain-containing protein [Amycolatopsis acididurans]
MVARKTIHRTVAAIAVAGVAAGATAFAAGTASADDYGPSVFACTSHQVTTQLVYGGAGMGNRNAALQITANPGERCYLPGKLEVDLVGAHDVLINDEAPADAPSVALTNGSSAYVPLHWTGIAPAAGQQTPNAITVDAPGEYNPHGDYIDPTMDLPWDLGAVDATPASHTIDVGAVTPGLAPTA